MEKNWVCLVCGSTAAGADKPVTCPVCGAGAAALRALEQAAQAPAAQTDAPGAARVWTCSICGWKCESADCPELCPVCGAGREAFTADAPVAVETPAAQAPVTKTDTSAAKKRWRCTICNMVFEGRSRPTVPGLRRGRGCVCGGDGRSAGAAQGH